MFFLFLSWSKRTEQEVFACCFHSYIHTLKLFCSYSFLMLFLLYIITCVPVVRNFLLFCDCTRFAQNSFIDFLDEKISIHIESKNYFRVSYIDHVVCNCATWGCMPGEGKQWEDVVNDPFIVDCCVRLDEQILTSVVLLGKSGNCCSTYVKKERHLFNCECLKIDFCFSKQETSCCFFYPDL